MSLWHNATDTYVVRDAAHATELYEAHIGEPYDAEECGAWREGTKPHDALLTIRTERTTKTIGEWIATLPNGGPLCSTEW